jgi:hypothetical protein
MILEFKAAIPSGAERKMMITLNPAKIISQ